jgi:hypothetical protein
MYGWAKAAGSVYQEQLRRNLTEALGVGWREDRNGCRELAGISEVQRRVFSKRTAQIEAHLARTGDQPVDPKARMQADEAASLATRRRKNLNWTPAMLAGRWHVEATSVDLPVGEQLTRRVQAAASAGERPPPSMKEVFARLVEPDTGVCAHDSRFGEAQVVEHVAAMGVGAWNAADIQTIAGRFLMSDLAVRLLDRDPSGRTEPKWSTVVHRRIEDRVLENLAAISDRGSAGLGAFPASLTHLGPDQADAVRTLCGPGPALRTLIAPAGHGKTTTLATAAAVLAGAGVPVVAMASTNQAVEQLCAAGLSATTIARFAIEGTALEPGTVVICDEVSQLPTREADVVLAAVARCQDGQVWFVGDPQQAQPVGAGGLGHYLTADPDRPAMVTAALTVNRRQADPDERAALVAYRAGDIDVSQALRQHGGWEHSSGSAEQARRAMAEAVAADIAEHGPQQVMALAVTHADCEEVADRIRAALIEAGHIDGPVLEGPGWVAPRTYQAGDRIVFHAHLRLDEGSRLTNGTTATVTAVGLDGLLIAPDGLDQPVTVPTWFAQARSFDGRPQLSHAWCRTIDGVQGGTWAQVHLLATPALDNYRGYVGQSRSIQPTHTWNTIPTPDPDHGGRLVTEVGTPAERVGAAMHRARPKTFAASDDPYRIDRHLHEEIAQHRRLLDQQPPDHSQELNAARAAFDQAEVDLAAARGAAESAAAAVADANTGLRRLTPGGRARRADADARLAYSEREVEAFEQRVGGQAARLADLLAAQNERDRHIRETAWRTERIADLGRQLQEHWTDAVVAAGRAGHPYAYGMTRLRDACQHLAVETPGPQRHGSTRRAELDLRQLDAALQVAEQAREVEIRKARLRATYAALRSPAEPVSVRRGIGPEL